MNREEALEFLLEDLKKLPCRQMCCEIPEEKLEEMAIKELQLEEIAEFLKVDKLDLTVEEFPINQRFQAALYERLLTEYSSYDSMIDGELWDIADEETRHFLENVERGLGVASYFDLCDVTVAEFLAYARSDKPDF